MADETIPAGARASLISRNHRVSVVVLGTLQDGRVVVRVLHLGGLQTSIKIGDVRAVARDRITDWTRPGRS